MKKLFLLLLTTTATLQADLATMTEADQKACGIEKLTPEERQALSVWVKNQIPQQPAPVTKSSKLEHGEYAITKNESLGRYITLENGSTYDIPSRSRKKTMGWKVGDKVRIFEPVRPINYKLENLDKKVTIGAKIAPTKPEPVEQK